MEWIISLLILISTAAHGLEHFPQNYQMAKPKLTLPCGRNDTHVTWTLNDQPLEDGDFGGVHVNGPVVTVEEVDTPVLGEYSCWSAGQKISSTFLLFDVEERDNLESLSCRAVSYDCSFACTWNNSGYDLARLALSQDCETKPCQWVSGIQTTDGSFLFELSHSLSPYAEESKMLELKVEAIIDHFILRRTKLFYLRDIVQPDSPRVGKYEVVGQELNVTIKPPLSWSSPHSFFSLENEIEYVLKDNGQTQKSSFALIPRKISKFRVRCRDSFVLSAWSPWTPWKNVKRRKGRRTKKSKKIC